jgi:hypothetical protein
MKSTGVDQRNVIAKLNVALVILCLSATTALAQDPLKALPQAYKLLF